METTYNSTSISIACDKSTITIQDIARIRNHKNINKQRLIIDRPLLKQETEKAAKYNSTRKSIRIQQAVN